MAVIQMPSRNGGDETGMITTWFKKTGDWVAQGDELFSFDTDEGTYTVKSQKAGRLVAIFVPEGELVHCPADVGMLAAPTPDSVLKMGRQQYIDESKPLSAREPAPQMDTAVEAAENIAQEASVPNDAAPIDVALPEADTDPSFAEEVISEDDAAEPSNDETPAKEIDDPVQLEENLIDELENESIAELMQLDEPAQEQDEPVLAEAAEKSAADMNTAEMSESAEQPTDSDENAAFPGNAEETAADEAKIPSVQPTVCPASISAQADLTCCMDIANRTGVKLSAMVRFAAMHTALAAYLEPLPVNTLRELNAVDSLPNLCDLSSTGITAATAPGCGALRLIVPAPHQAMHLQKDAPSFYPCLNLTLCFDENTLSLSDAAQALHKTCEHLENLLALLI